MSSYTKSTTEQTQFAVSQFNKQQKVDNFIRTMIKKTQTLKHSHTHATITMIIQTVNSSKQGPKPRTITIR